MKTTTVTVQKWGGSLAVRLPSNVVRDARLTPGQEIEVSCRGGIITMKIVGKADPTLRDRIDDVQRRVKDGARAVASRVRQ